MKLFSRILAFVVLTTLGVLAFQNCQKSKEVYDTSGSASSSSEATPTPTPGEEIPLGNVTVKISKRIDFADSTTTFDYGDTIYEEVENLGFSGKACEEVNNHSYGYCDNAANYVTLQGRLGWTYDSTRKVWKRQSPAKDYFGMTAYQMFKKVGGEIVSRVQTYRVNSVANFNNGNEIVVFASTDVQGLQVQKIFGQSQRIFSHVKNGSTNFKVCQWVKRNVDGTTVATNPCTTSSLSTAIWVALPAEASTVNDGPNSTMLTYDNPPNTFHITDIGSYIYDGSVIKGPFWMTIQTSIPASGTR